MKTSSALTILLVALIMASCHKANIQPKTNTQPKSPLAGNWSLVSDSTYAVNFNGTITGSTYTGTTSDQYVFNNNNVLYVKVGNIKLDTASYTVSGDTLKLAFSYFHENGLTARGNATRYIIKSFTKQTMVLTQNIILTGALYSQTESMGEIITLSANNN